MSDAEDIFRQALAENAEEIRDLAQTAEAIGWVQHLASPPDWEAVWPKVHEPLREMLLRQVEGLLRQLQRGETPSGSAARWMHLEGRVEKAEHLRSLLERWSPPTLTEDIVEAARALLAPGP